jgi:murein DD-endopeptidase MepM/ murein hydrolase activator NlpD
VNERHPSGHTPDYDAYTYDACSTGAYQAVGTAFADDTTTGTYGWLPQQQPADPYAYEPQQPGDVSYGTGGYGGYGYAEAQPQSYDPYAAQAAPAAYDTGTYDTGQFAAYSAYQTSYQQQPEWDSGAYPAYGYGYGYDTSGDTGVYEQLAPQQQPAYEEQAYQPQAYEPQHDPYAFPAAEAPGTAGAAGVPETTDAAGFPEVAVIPEVPEVPDALTEEHSYAPDGPEPGAPVARSRRRKPKRSALLTVAVPSVAVMGVAAVGAAAVTGVGTAQGSGGKAQADGAGKAPTTQLDRQLAGVSADADDFADRASRTQERIDLKDRQAAAKKKAEEEAARKEALRPKFFLPVTQHGLSAYFGQSGVNWMSVHTGIDFPVMVGTPVRAVTDGTVRTQWNSSYGNMAIVTAPDGTETWYCHLSSTKIRSGKVQAGTVIAYSGNTGNTTGPHLHLEVRPDGGSPIDPLAWLLKHGLDPR